MSLDALIEEAMRLPIGERAALIGRLLQKLDEGEELTSEAWDAAWSQELERRARDVDSRAVELLDADVALARVRAWIPARP